jgi:hypothetical protein
MAEAWTPPVKNCSRCGTPLPSSATGWRWLEFEDDDELVCPDCLTPDEMGRVFDRLNELKRGAK